MKKFLLSFLIFCLFFTHLTAQDPLSMVFEANKIRPVVEGIESIISFDYATFNLDESRSPDSLLISEGDTIELFLSNKMVETYPAYGETVQELYDKEGKLKSTDKIFQDSTGRVLKRSTEFADARLAMFMNSTLKYGYDSLNQLTSAREAGIEIMRIDYDEAGILQGLQINMGFGKMSYVRETTKSGYKFSLDLHSDAGGEGIFGKMGEKMNNSKESSYFIYQFKEGMHHYTMIEEDKESHEITKKTRYVRDAKGHLIEMQELVGGTAHNMYSYNEKGEVLEVKDLLSDEVRKSEVDERGNITKLFEDYTSTTFEYDGKNNMVVKKKYTGSGEDSLINLTLRKITYK